MNRFLSFIVFLFASMLVAGVFGALHDQISYTVSSEYFTHFKFFQFRLLNPEVPERLRAAEVGFRATWWLGLPLGGLSGGVGVLLHRNLAVARRALLLSLPLIAAVTLAVALLGLAYGYYRTAQLDLANYSNWFVPEGLRDLRAYLCVGYMHNAAYLGGLLAVPASWVFHVAYRRRMGLR